MVRRKTVEVGQQYRQADASWLVWEVVELFRDSRGHPHAHIQAARNLGETRAIACAVLQDPRRYRLLRKEDQ